MQFVIRCCYSSFLCVVSIFCLVVKKKQAAGFKSILAGEIHLTESIEMHERANRPAGAHLQLHDHVAAFVVVEAVLYVSERFFGTKTVQEMTILAQHHDVAGSPAFEHVVRKAQQD